MKRPLLFPTAVAIVEEEIKASTVNGVAKVDYTRLKSELDKAGFIFTPNAIIGMVGRTRQKLHVGAPPRFVFRKKKAKTKPLVAQQAVQPPPAAPPPKIASSVAARPATPPPVASVPLAPTPEPAPLPRQAPVAARPYGRVITCMWPIGEPGKRSFHFCDSPSEPGKPYCGEHAKLAYVKIRDRREDAS